MFPASRRVAMTPLRQRMIDAMQLRGLAARTQHAYVAAVVGLARHYGCSPENLDGLQVHQPAGRHSLPNRRQWS
jgi:hypothetical protein